MLLERNQVGKREMLANLIARVDAKNTPVTSMMGRGEALTNMLFEWQMDNFEAPAELAAEDGTDVSAYSNASEDRTRAQMYAMKVRDSAMVSDLAENVSDVAGLSKGELAESIMKKLKRLARTIESYICGDQDCQAGAAGVPHKSRGLGSWISSSAQTTLPVAAAFRTPAASIDATAMATLTESLVGDVLASVYGQTGQITDFKFPCGPILKKQFSSFTRTTGGVATYPAPTIRAYTTNFNGTVSNVVNVFEGDFGALSLIPTLWNAYELAAFGSPTAGSNGRRGYAIDPAYTKLHYKRLPRVKELEDRGGGPRFLVDAILGWSITNPLAFGKFNATT
jgi:hypothetical protein